MLNNVNAHSSQKRQEKIIGFRVDKRTAKRFLKTVNREGETPSRVLRRLVIGYLDKLEGQTESPKVA